MWLKHKSVLNLGPATLFGVVVSGLPDDHRIIGSPAAAARSGAASEECKGACKAGRCWEAGRPTEATKGLLQPECVVVPFPRRDCHGPGGRKLETFRGNVGPGPLSGCRLWWRWTSGTRLSIFRCCEFPRCIM
jgi:hypothetical protein